MFSLSSSYVLAVLYWRRKIFLVASHNISGSQMNPDLFYFKLETGLPFIACWIPSYLEELLWQFFLSVFTSCWSLSSPHPTLNDISAMRNESKFSKSRWFDDSSLIFCLFQHDRCVHGFDLRLLRYCSHPFPRPRYENVGWSEKRLIHS